MIKTAKLAAALLTFPVNDNDFSYYITQYLENGLVESHETYTAEGELISASTHSYEYYEDGSVKKKYNYEDGALLGSAEFTYYENGSIKTITNYDANGAFMNEIELDQDGNPIET